MPDEELFNAAESGELETLAGRVKQATRLLAHPKARDALATLQVNGSASGDTAGKPQCALSRVQFALAAVMQEETRQFVNHVVFDSTGTLAELFTADYAFVNDALAPIYDMEAIDGAELRLQPSLSYGKPVCWPTQHTDSTAHSDQTSPIRRGLFVRERACQSLGTPLSGRRAGVDPNATTRAIGHMQRTVLFVCHVYIDELGSSLNGSTPLAHID